MSTQVLSDKQIIESQASVVSRQRPYADLDLKFRVNPSSRDVRPVKDLSAIKNSVRNLILTNRLERPFQPEIGCNLTKLLFEPADPITISLIKEDIINTIENYEPRVSLSNIQIEDYADRNAYFVSIEFRVVSLDSEAQIEFYLERVK